MDNTGLARGTVRLVLYNLSWSARFAAEAALLQQELGIDAGRIQHVGSTAIPGIFAKPVIDIAILVDSLAVADVWAKPLAELGYWNKGPQSDMPELAKEYSDLKVKLAASLAGDRAQYTRRKHDFVQGVLLRGRVA